jgi:uncharacterized protein YkwD
MLRVDGRLLAAAVAAVFLVGAGAGFGIAGSVGGAATDDPDAGPATATPTASPVPAPATLSATTTASPASTVTHAPTPTATLTPTPTTTATAPATATRSPSPTTTRTPMLVRRFEVAEIESEIRRLVNEWRDEQGLPGLSTVETRLVADLNAMARSHSVAMADAGETIHTIDNRTSADRYHEYEVYWECRFHRNGHEYTVTPNRNRLEVLGKTYAGRTYTDVDGTDYNANETAVARDIVEAWTTREPFRQRLSYRNVTRLGVGVETTRDNEVYVTGNLCGVKPRFVGGE